MPTSRSTPRNHVDLDSIILDLWVKTRPGQVFASKAVAETFARNKSLSSHDRKVIADTLYGMLGHARRIEHALNPIQPGALAAQSEANGIARSPTRERTDASEASAGSADHFEKGKPVGLPGRSLTAGGRRACEAHASLALLLTYRLLTGALTVEQAQRILPGTDWPAVLASDLALKDESDQAKRIGIRASLPDFLVERLMAEYGDEAETLALALNEQPPLMLRVNTIRASREKILGQFAKAGHVAHPAAYSETGIELESRGNIFRLKQFTEGQVEPQDEGSQLVCLLVAPPPKGLVIDYCAGAGGKTLALSALMKNAGRLIALDVHDKRLD